MVRFLAGPSQFGPFRTAPLYGRCTAEVLKITRVRSDKSPRRRPTHSLRRSACRDAPPLIGSPSRPSTTPVGAALGRCRRISGGVLDCCDLVPAMDEFPSDVPALADRIGDDCIVPVTMPRFIGGVENAGEHTPVSQGNAHGFAEIGFNLLIGHALEIA
jgi:hypothetical protein